MARSPSSHSELREYARRLAKNLSIPDPPTHGEDLRAISARCLKGLSVAGLMELDLPSPGSEKPIDFSRPAIIAEGLAYESGTLASIFMVNAIFAGSALAMLGTEEQKLFWLPLLVGARAQFAFGLSEPGAGSDAGAIETSAVRENGGFALNGIKLYTTGALTADCILVVARVRDAGRKPGVFIVRPNTDGLSIEPLAKLAGGAQPSCLVRMDTVCVPTSDLLGGEAGLDKSWQALRITGSLERLVVAASCLGTADRIFEECRDFAKSRVQFGQRIVNFQAINHMLVEMETAVRIMRLLVRDAVEHLKSGKDPTTSVCTAKYVCADRLQWIAGAGMRVLGGRAYLAENVMSRIYREAPLALYAGGTIEVQKNLIAQALGFFEESTQA